MHSRGTTTQAGRQGSRWQVLTHTQPPEPTAASYPLQAPREGAGAFPSVLRSFSGGGTANRFLAAVQMPA